MASSEEFCKKEKGPAQGKGTMVHSSFVKTSLVLLGYFSLVVV